jgi:hypothetical protein
MSVGRIRIKRPKERDPQRRGYQEDRLIRQEMAGNTEHGGRREAADGSETLIAAKPFGECVMSDKSKTDSSHRRTEQAAGHALKQRGGQDRREIRSKRENQQCQCHGGGCDADQRPPRSDQVDDFASGNLADETRKAARRQHKANARGRPSAIRQVDRDKGSEAGEQRREKEVQPVEPMQTCQRRRCFLRVT